MRMRKALVRPARVSDARTAAGLPAKATCGRAPAVTNGTRSTPEGSARHATSGGLKRNASHAPAGRHTRIGMRNKARLVGRNRTKNAEEPWPLRQGERDGYSLARSSQQSRIACQKSQSVRHADSGTTLGLYTHAINRDKLVAQNQVMEAMMKSDLVN